MSGPLASITPSAAQDAFMRSLKDTLRTSGNSLSPVEWLAITSQFLGILVAIQDQRKLTKDDVMAMVAANIEEGNRSYIEFLTIQTAGRA